MKEKIEEWLEWLSLLAICLLATIILIATAIFSPIASILNKIKKVIAITGLVSEQQKLLKELNGYRTTCLCDIAQELSGDEDYSQAQMVNSAEGYAVLYFQEETRKLRKANIENLISDCHEANIAKWRIWLVKP